MSNTLDIAGRRKACEDTIRRTPDITALIARAGAFVESSFIPTQLPPLSKSHPLYPGHACAPIKIHNSDTFALARTLNSVHGEIGVLNLASDREPGGGWRHTLSQTQEEALCYSSTLYSTLKSEWYPFPNTGPGSCAGIISPNVVVFKDTLEHGLVDLPARRRHTVVVITVAAPCRPELTPEGEDLAHNSDVRDLQGKILLVLRLAATNNITTLILGAMGCGAYGCPPRAVARQMKAALEREEFEGWFERVVFAIYAAGSQGERNLAVFEETFA